jgi:cytochrome c
MKTLAMKTAAAAAAWMLAHGAATAADMNRGEKAFDDCRACHSVERGVNGVGPSLNGVFGRKAATLDDFRYSPAFKRASITWTKQSLDTFLADPQKIVPGNRMPYSGMPDAKDRADLIEYMMQATK